MSYVISHKSFNQRKAGGFTLIELMVTLAIFVMMTTVVLGNYPKFNNKIALEMLAQNMALSIREAQVYGISVRATNVNSSKLSPSYGMHFIGPTYTSFAQTSGQNKRQYVLFSDGNGNKKFWENGFGYEPGFVEEQLTCTDPTNPANECVQVFNITGQSQVGLICTNLMQNLTANSNGQYTINDPGTHKLQDCMADPVTHAEVLFQRPNPEAEITAFHSTSLTTQTSVNDIEIFVHSTSKAGQDRMIVIWSTGQISVQTCDTNYSVSNANFGNCSVK